MVDSATSPGGSGAPATAPIPGGSAGTEGHDEHGEHTGRLPGAAGSAATAAVPRTDAGPGASNGVPDAVTPRDRFAVALSTSDCKGGCPMYDLKLGENGMVEFNGRGNTRQQGMIVRSVSPETIAEIHQAIDAANYWMLHDAYRVMNDGCAQVDTESATYTWNVSNQDTAKIVIDYQGCQGVSELDALRKIPQLLIDTLKLSSWVGR